MPRVILGIIISLVAIIVRDSSAEDLVVKIQRGKYTKFESAVDPAYLVNGGNRCVELVKSDGVITESVELHVKTDEKFRFAVQAGELDIRVQGEVGARKPNGRHLLKLQTMFKNPLGDDAPTRRCNITFPLEVNVPQYIVDDAKDAPVNGKSTAIPLSAKEPRNIDHVVFFVTLQPEKSLD